MPAKSKSELLAATELEFSKLTALLAEFGVRSATRKRQENTSLKDVVGHRAHWIDLFFGWYQDGQAGKEVFFPAKGYKWNQLTEYNKKLRENQSSLSWTDVNNNLLRNHKKLVKFINTRSDKELYDGTMKGAKSDWTLGRWAEAAGPSHYRSARKFARQCKKDDS